MIYNKSIFLLLLSIVGGIVLTTTTPVQLSYSTPSSPSESSREAVGQQQEEPSNEPSGDDQPTDDQPTSQEDETETESTVSKPTGGVEINPAAQTDEELQEQKQLSLDIISSNGLVVVNQTFPGTAGDSRDETLAGGGDGTSTGTSNVGNTEKQVTCVKNDKGEVFCYETLPTDEHCLKPIEVEDPPLCQKGQ